MLKRRNREVTKEEHGCLAKAGAARGRFQPKRKAQGQTGQRHNDSAQYKGNMVAGCTVCGLFQTSVPIKGTVMLGNGQHEYHAGQRLKEKENTTL